MNVFLYVLDKLSDWEIGYLTAEINSARYFNPINKKIIFTKIGSTIQPIYTMGGIKIIPDQALSDIKFYKG
jgi:hypothetical protein